MNNQNWAEAWLLLKMLLFVIIKHPIFLFQTLNPIFYKSYYYSSEIKGKDNIIIINFKICYLAIINIYIYIYIYFKNIKL